MVEEIKAQCATIYDEINLLCDQWLKPALDRLDKEKVRAGFPKVFNDPIWKTIEFLPWELLLLDSPLLQRLRGVKQLGLAHYVYPGATHDRLEHARGVVEAASRMMQRLDLNASHRRTFGRADTDIPQIGARDRYDIRLASLLHDIGHGPFSHAIEPVIEERYGVHFEALSKILRKHFDGTASISISEAIAVLVVLSDQMDKVLHHSNFDYGTGAGNLGVRLAARILGSYSELQAGYLSGIVSGPTDADKLDYMARDAYHAGLPIGLDTDRLIAKLEVIAVRADDVPLDDPQLKARAAANNGKFYEAGISSSGLSAYEQMLVNRVLLYDKLYYHHKVRAADAMAQRLILAAESERKKTLELRELFLNVSDDTAIAIFGGLVHHPTVEGGRAAARDLAECIVDRRLYHRAFAFAARFINGIADIADEQLRENNRRDLWSPITKDLAKFTAIRDLELKIYEECGRVAAGLDAYKAVADKLKPHHVIVDLPINKSRPSGNLLFTRTEDDKVGLPNLYFDPERWSNAYNLQKRCGYVFAPKSAVPLVSLAAKIVFFRHYRAAMNELADRHAKVGRGSLLVDMETLKAKAVVDLETYEALTTVKLTLGRFQVEEITVPAAWEHEDVGIRRRIVDELNLARPGGYSVEYREKICNMFNEFACFAEAKFKGGNYKAKTILEKDLQADAADFFRTRDCNVVEGAKVGGGPTDLIVDDVLVENKRHDTATAVPLEVGSTYPFQARHYAIALCKTFFFTLVAYEPKTSAAILPLTQSFKIVRMKDVPGGHIEIRFVIPFQYGNPSSAKTS